MCRQSIVIEPGAELDPTLSEQRRGHAAEIEHKRSSAPASGSNRSGALLVADPSPVARRDRSLHVIPRIRLLLGRAIAGHGATELVTLVLLFVAYNIVRALPHESTRVAVSHAWRMFSLESWLFPYLERPLNTWLEATPVAAVAACYYYAAFHYIATPTVLLISRHRGGWRYRRGYWTLVLASAFALVGYALYPTAPPRLVPDLGIVDVMRSYADYGWWGAAASAPRGIGDATNQYAAMPSMHFGWALWCSIQMWGFRHRIWKLLAVAYPSLLLVVVLATGNHFLVDVLAGGACVLVAHVVVDRVVRRTPRAVSAPLSDLSSPARDERNIAA